MDELWTAGNRDLAAEIASPENTTVRVKKDSVIPGGWRLLLFRHVASPDLGIYAVAGPDDRIVLLSDQPKGFSVFAKRSGLKVESSDAAIRVAEFYLDKTRDLSRHQYLLREPADTRLSTVRDTTAARKRLDRIVRPPSAKASRHGYKITLYVQRETAVDRWTGTIGADGGVDGRFRTVIEKLPVEFPRL